MAFLLTESSDALVADSAGTDLSSQHDEDSKEKLNGEEPATVATDTWQHVNDDDDVRKTHIFFMISSLFPSISYPCTHRCLSFFWPACELTNVFQLETLTC